MHSIFSVINDLQENSDCHYIDVLPKRIVGDEFFTLEEYLLETGLHDFANSISGIVIKLIHYYPAQIYLTELDADVAFEYAARVGEDLRSISLPELSEIITHVILHDISSVQVVLGNEPYTIISINGHFSVDIYNATGECLELLKMLTQQEGLFLNLAE